MKVGSLFSGVGCGDLGLEWAGFEHAWFVEVNEYARQVLELRWPGRPIYGDIKEVDFTAVEPVDVLAGGFPCQDISIAGKGAGIKGERSGLWSEFARAIAEIRPRYALIENSPILITRGLDVVLSDLAALGYDAEWNCIPASALGAPHKRDRIWIVAYADNRSGNTQKAIRTGRDSSQSGGADMADSLRERLSLSGSKSFREDGEQGRRQSPPKGWWSSEPGVGRVANGTPHRVDRLKGIGNGQVPHCTYIHGLAILEHYGATISKSVEEK